MRVAKTTAAGLPMPSLVGHRRGSDGAMMWASAFCPLHEEAAETSSSTVHQRHSIRSDRMDARRQLVCGHYARQGRRGYVGDGRRQLTAAPGGKQLLRRIGTDRTGIANAVTGLYLRQLPTRSIEQVGNPRASSARHDACSRPADLFHSGKGLCSLRRTLAECLAPPSSRFGA
jgi:hypothetical protein